MPAQGCGKWGVHGVGVLPLRIEPGRHPAEPQQLPSGEAGLFTVGRGDLAAKDPPLGLLAACVGGGLWEVQSPRLVWELQDAVRVQAGRRRRRREGPPSS